MSFITDPLDLAPFGIAASEAREAIEADAARVRADLANRAALKAKADAAEAAHQARKASPLRYYGIHEGGGRPIRYAPLPLLPGGEERKDKNRTLELDGENFEHVATDADGVWIYRRM